MKQEQIEKAGIDYANNKPYNETVLNKNAFIAGAQWLADRLCHLPLDRLVQELAEYINQKEEQL